MRNKTLKTFLVETSPGASFEAPVTVVLGNQAADLDSIVSAILYAYYLFLTDPSCNPRALVPVHRDDFKLRSEAVFLFKKTGIDPSFLHFSGDLDLFNLARQGKLRLFLVDHNRLSAGLEGLEENVTGILDHHEDEGRCPSIPVRVIRPVGSTATLVAEGFFQDLPGALDSSAAVLLLGTILLDTVNLNPRAGRCTASDEEAVKKLAALTGEDTASLFQRLESEKFQPSSLSGRDFLRKDYKEYRFGKTVCGISSIFLPLEEWIAADPAAKETVEGFARGKKLDLLLLMHAFTFPAFSRQLGVYAPDPVLRKKLLLFLEGSELVLEKEAVSRVQGIVYYRQKNTALSRKRLQPLLEKFFYDFF